VGGQDEDFDQEITVNFFEDSLDGTCATGSTTCNLRAAVATAVAGGGSALIDLPATASHYIENGEIVIPARLVVKFTCTTDLATINGRDNAASASCTWPRGRTSRGAAGDLGLLE
jgi:hypothetical protein